MTEQSARGPTHLLQDPWPGFLDLVDVDRAAAFEQFYLFGRRLLLTAPPRTLLDVPPDSREDVIHDSILHCCRDDFRILRQYRNHGKPFASWFRQVAHNKLLERLRTRKGQDALQPLPFEVPDRPAVASSDPAALVSNRALLRVPGTPRWTTKPGDARRSHSTGPGTAPACRSRRSTRDPASGW